LPASSAEMTDDIVKAANGVVSFVEEMCVLGPDAKATENELYAAYDAWRTAYRVRPISKRDLIGSLIKCGRGSITRTRLRDGTDLPRDEQARPRGLAGIGVRPKVTT
jgi:phage/plasmid-associated DNA primase